MNKKNKAVFFRKEPCMLDERLSAFVVEQVVELSPEEYQRFASHLLSDWNFLWDNSELMYVDEHGIWHCLLVKALGARYGLLVNSSGHHYARYVVYCPNCADVGESEERGMKTYLAKFSIRDGEHEYGAAFLVQAESLEEATTIAKSQEHDPVIPDDLCEDKVSCWDYGDGTTAARLDGVVEIECEEAHVLKRFGLVFDFN
jgi:hypothetical protein